MEAHPATATLSGHRQRLVVAAVCAVVAVLSLVLARLTPPMVGDEPYHHPLAVLFAQGFPVFADSYTSAYPPLPYLLVGAWMHVAGTSLYAARAFNLIVGIAGIIGFLLLARRAASRDLLLPVLFLAFQPYYLRNCSVFHMGNYGVAAVIWALRFYLDERRPRNLWLAAVLLGAATLCSQWSLAVVGGVLLAEAVRAIDEDWKTSAARVRGFFSVALPIAALQVPALVVFAGWGGLTHPNFPGHGVEVSVQHITGTLAVVGFTFAFWLLGRLRSVSPGTVAVLVIVAPLLWLSMPEVSVLQGAKQFTGLAVQLLAGVSARAGCDGPVLIVPAAMLGLLLLHLLCRPEREPLLAVRFGTLLLMVAYAFSVMLGETHVAFCMPLFFMLAWVARGRDLWLRLVVAQNAVLGIAYALYFGLLKGS